MNVDELSYLASWLSEQTRAAQQRYEKVQAILQHNSQQPDKQPYESELNELLSCLHDMPIYDLTNEQLKYLEFFEVTSYLGKNGLDFVERTIIKSDFDPATAASEMATAVSQVNSANNRANSIVSALNGIAIGPLELELEEQGRALIRVEFQNDAAINNVVDLKSWSDQWHHIVRGISMAVGQAPQDVSVVGATRGSIILELAGTYLFVKIAAAIFKAIIGVAKQQVVYEQTLEDLRTKKLLNQKIEAEIKSEATNRKDAGIQSVMEAVKAKIPTGLNGDQEAALEKAVKNLLDFSRKGGDLDFVPPREFVDEEGKEVDEIHEQLLGLKDAISELVEEKEELKRISGPAE